MVPYGILGQTVSGLSGRILKSLYCEISHHLQTARIGRGVAVDWMLPGSELLRLSPRSLWNLENSHEFSGTSRTSFAWESDVRIPRVLDWRRLKATHPRVHEGALAQGLVRCRSVNIEPPAIQRKCIQRLPLAPEDTTSGHEQGTYRVGREVDSREVSSENMKKLHSVRRSWFHFANHLA